METQVRNNIEIVITLTNASKEYLFYLNDILHGLESHFPTIFEYSIMRPTEKNNLSIKVHAFGCPEGFRLRLYNIFNTLFKDDTEIFNYQTIKSDSYTYDPSKVEERNLRQCDKLFDAE